MRNTRMILGVCFMVVLMTASKVLAQDPTTAPVTSASSAPTGSNTTPDVDDIKPSMVAWHCPTQSGQISENLRLNATATWGIISLNDVRRQRHDAQIWGGSASADYRLTHNPDGRNLDVLLGAVMEASFADDSSGFSSHGGIRGVSVLDRNDVTGKVRLSLWSTPENSATPNLAWHVSVATGAGFQSWNGDRPMWVSSVDAEVSYNLLDNTYNPLGLYAGFHGSLGMGNNSSYQLDGRLSAGLRGTTNGTLSEWRVGLTTSGFMNEANRRRNYLLESNGHTFGFEVALTLWGRLTLSLSGELPFDFHIHERDRENLNAFGAGRHDMSSRENEQAGAVKGGVGLSF